jgi:magnesium and cobalt exporter, CNNM family
VGPAVGTVLRLSAVALLIGVNALLVACEFATVAADGARVEREADAGGRSAGRARRVLARLSYYLSGTQLGITAIALLLGFLAEPAIATAIQPLLEPIFGESSAAARNVSIVLALILATVAQMVLGELIPKAVAIARAHRLVLKLSPLILAYGALLGPVIRVMNGVADAVVRLFGVEPREALGTSRTLDEFLVVIEGAADEGAIDDVSRQLLERSIRFGDKTAAAALVPRVDVTALPSTATLQDLAEASVRTGFSRFPLYRRDLDDIVGVVHVKRLFGVPYEQRATVPVTAVMDEPFVVPESRDLDSLLLEMGSRGSHLAVVADEYGDIAGIITAEDVIEEIVGTIDDEHDPRLEPQVARDGDDYLLSGTLHPDEVEEACGFEVPEGDYETLAGFLLERFARFPAVGATWEEDGWRFVVEGLERRRISRVRVTPPRRPVSNAPDGWDRGSNGGRPR